MISLAALKGRNNFTCTPHRIVAVHANSTRRQTRPAARPSAFTLFELILAIALSVTLVALIGTAINLYLTRVDGSRTQVEEAQLARSILAMIADDFRAATVYQPQDTSAIAQLLASTAAFDVDSIDDERQGSGGGGGSTSSGAPSGSSSLGGGGSGGSGSSGGLGSGGLSTGMSSTGGQSTESDTTLPLGLSGTVNEVYVDSTRLPRREELFATVTGYTNAPAGVPTGALAASATTASAAGMVKPSDLKTVRYFIRPGQSVEPGSAGATSLAPEVQQLAGGLVRQEVPRSMRVWAEQSGNTAVLDSGQALIAPEVVHIEFRYFDGLQVTDYWDMREKNALPVAIEVRLWIAPSGADGAAISGRYDPLTLANTAREYRQTVYLPMSQLANSAAMASMSGAGGMNGSSSQSGSGTGTSGTTGSSATGGSSFGEF
jgi:uncharacterized membrane protein YgcG